MVDRTIYVTTHLRNNDPPDLETIKVVLGEIVSAIYGQPATEGSGDSEPQNMVVLKLHEGGVNVDKKQNMLRFRAALNPAIEHVVEEMLLTYIGQPFVLSYNHGTVPRVLLVDTRLKAAKKKLSKLYG